MTSRVERRAQLLQIHGRGLDEVGGAGCDAFTPDTIFGADLTDSAQIDDVQMRAELTSQNTDGRTA